MQDHAANHSTPYALRQAISPFMESLRADFAVEGGGVGGRVVLLLQAFHMNTGGVAHGGVIMSLLDSAMATSGKACDPEQRK